MATPRWGETRGRKQGKVEQPFLYEKNAADGAAATATAEQVFARVHTAGLVVGAQILPNAALTANDTTNATITLRKRDGVGGAAVDLATLTTNLASGNWVAFTTKAMTLAAAANLELAAGSVLTFEITKGSTGVIVPISAFVLAVHQYPVGA